MVSAIFCNLKILVSAILIDFFCKSKKIYTYLQKPTRKKQLFLGKKRVFIETYKYSKSLENRLFLVEVTGIEPATSSSQTTRATNCATPRDRYLLQSTYLLYHKNISFAIFLLNFLNFFCKFNN